MNKKANIALFGFFFTIVLLSGLFLFMGVGLHYISYDYGIEPVADLGQTLLNSTGNSTTGALSAIETLKGDYVGNSSIFDWLFLIFMIALFIESCAAAIRTKRSGWLSFFGFVTVGNLLFGLMLYFSIQIRGWILNEIFYKIITESFTSTWIDYFINNTWQILFIWYLILLILSTINVDLILSKIGLGNKEQDFNEGRFEE